jgi:outer membrane immunogenic protein
MPSLLERKMGLRTILTGVGVSVCALTAANAADVGGLKDSPYMAAAVNWGGFYGGWTAGYGWGTSANWVQNNGNQHGWANNDPDGVTLGGTIGYNWQYTPNWVFGVEGDMSWMNMEGTQHLYVYDGHDWSGGWDGFGTVRGRVGYAIGKSLVYGTAGLALLHTNEVLVGDNNNANQSNFNQGWHVGYVVGAGVEYAFGNRLSAKAEYLYGGGFPEWCGTTGAVTSPGDQAYKHDETINIFRVGLNYKFF